MTNRMAHTNCLHDATPAGRKLCRSGHAIVKDLAFGDTVTVAGVVWSITKVYSGWGPAEVRVKRYVDGMWRDCGWMNAWQFAGGRVDRDPRNV